MQKSYAAVLKSEISTSKPNLSTGCAIPPSEGGTMKMSIEPDLGKMNSRLETLEQDSLCAVVMIQRDAVDKLIKDVANHLSAVSDETSVSGNGSVPVI